MWWRFRPSRRRANGSVDCARRRTNEKGAGAATRRQGARARPRDDGRYAEDTRTSASGWTPRQGQSVLWLARGGRPFGRPQCGPGVLGATFPFLPRSFRGYDFRSPGAATQCWHREVERFLWLMCLGCVATAAFAGFLWSRAFCGTWAIRPLLASTGVARGARERTLSLSAGRRRLCRAVCSLKREAFWRRRRPAHRLVAACGTKRSANWRHRAPRTTAL